MNETDTKEMSPQELAEASAKAMYSRDVAARELGIQLREMGPGRCILEMTVRPEMINGHGVCHGGFIFALADTAFAYACNSGGRVNLAQGASIDFVSPGRVGETLTATAEQRFQAGRTGLYDITVQREDGEPVAHFRGRSYQVRASVLEPPGPVIPAPGTD